MANLSSVYNSATSINPFVGVMTPPTAPVVAAPPVKPIFSKAPAAPAATLPVDPYAKYRNPQTGDVMNPQEYATYWGDKAKTITGSSDVGNYAGNSYAATNQSANTLNTTANNLNNFRNDIATGNTDPYKVGSQSGIPYTASELSAIEKAYAGIYDPAINDVFARLKEKQTADDAQAKKDDQIFQTNENIRQWRATTGTKNNNNKTTTEKFTPTQIKQVARNAGVSIAIAGDMDPDLANFFYAPPKVKDTNDNDKVKGMDKMFEEDMKAVSDGSKTADELSQEIMDANLSEAVKTYFINQIPNEPAKKSGFIEQVWTPLWNAILGK